MGKKGMSDLVEFMRDSETPESRQAKLKAAAGGKAVVPGPKPAGVTSSVVGTSTDPRSTPFVKTANLQAIDDKPEAGDNDGVNEALYKGIIAAVPTLIGAAFGNTGGAVGAQAGVGAIKDFDTIKKTQLATKQANEKQRYDRGVQAQKLANEAEGLAIRQQDVNQKKGLRQDMKTQHDADKDFDRKRQYQQDFDKDPQVTKVNETRRLIDELRGNIERGDGQAAKAVQFRLATLYNGGRPTDADVQAFKGSPTALESLKTFVGMKFDDKLTDKNKEIYRSLISNMEGASERALNRMADIHSKQASVRFNKPAKELRGWLKLDGSGVGDEAPTGDDAEKKAIIDSILGGGS